MKKIIGLSLAVASFGAVAAEWDKVTPSADFRFRNENVSVEEGDSNTRQRIRARVGFDYDVDKNLHFHTRFASGSSSATSTNQDLDGGNDHGSLMLDRAYVGQHMGDAHIHLGMMKNYYTRIGGTQLIWDGDVNLQGIHASYSTMGAYINLGSFSYDSEKASEGDQDVTLLASQLGYKGKAGTFGYHVGVSNYHYQGIRENTGSADGMNMLETYLGLSMDMAMPVSVYFTAVTNGEADDLNKASAMGLKIGKTKKKGDWSLGYEMRSIETNSVLADQNDGDFADSQTDSSGSIISAKYKTCDKSAVKLTMYSNLLDVEEDNGGEKAYNKMHVDYSVKF
jgi:hypothetical protein